MKKRHFFRTLLAVTAFLAAGEAALAQSAECQRFRAELANLNAGGGRAPSGAAEGLRVEIGRLVGYYRSIGCERGPLGFLSGSPPAECGAISQRIRQLESNFARASAQSPDSGEIELRRRQLMSAVQQTCAVEQPRGFFETLFGPPRAQQPQQQIMPEGQPIISEENNAPATGGRRLVCVRTCDGSFFPLSVAPGGRQNADEMCQALCPGTETIAFGTPGGDDALNRAVSISGRPYTSIANAFRFRKAFDSSCACKKDNESWAVVLRRAESMLEQRKGDIIVTAEKAEELSRPKVVQARKAAEKKVQEEAKEAAETAAAAPTASRESSGIGPQSIESNRIVNQGEGAKKDVVTATGQKRTVRVISPDVIPVPNTN
ncbi:DUF2865 domain-containing protein [Microvirga antarctica]|uniref:DUF2865 domain-containing protein n=1 Tax=Microvirga antarctica TaxID=2819233 RepID=UPI001FE94C9A|nr:DUF2865 domain-containing protein [Microvirga antarctica]